jgi:hypothetical protein
LLTWEKLRPHIKDGYEPLDKDWKFETYTVSF